eukprot:9472004-Karenia_brevis.AAC.1
MGPDAHIHMWTAAVQKYIGRCCAIAASAAAASLRIRTYNSKAVSVLWYIGQLYPPPIGWREMQRKAVQRI